MTPLVARISGVLSSVSFMAGCTHTYVFAGDRPPRFENGEVIVEVPGERPERYPVERVVVAPKSGAARLPTTEEIRAWEAGIATPEIDILRVDVSTTGHVWSDWIAPGAGIGASLILVTVGGLGLVTPDGSNNLTLPIVLAMAFALAVEGGLIGGGLGALGEGGTTDMRFPGGASIYTPLANPLFQP